MGAHTPRYTAEDALATEIIEKRVMLLEQQLAENARGIAVLSQAGIDLDRRMGQFDKRMDRLEERIDRLEQRMDQGFAAVDRRFELLEQRVDQGFAAVNRWFLLMFSAQVAIVVAVLGALASLFNRLP